MIVSVSSLIPLFLLASQVAAAPNVVRAESSATTTAPEPWVSVLDDGTASTVTPVVSTNAAGQATTIDARPTGTAEAASDDDDDIYSKCDSTKYQSARTGNTQPWIPFCAPRNGTSWWYSGNYYVTWNPSYFPGNASKVLIVLNYKDAGGAGRIADSWETSNAYGSLPIKPEQSWLINQTARDDGLEYKLDSQILYFTIANSDSSQNSGPQVGPTITLTSTPTAPPTDTDPRNRPPPSTLGLAIGLPLVAAFAFGSICCLHFCLRTKRKVGPISIGGGRKHFSKRGYSGRAERRKKAAMGGQAAYRDEAEEAIAASPIDERRAEWELANVKGGR